MDGLCRRDGRRCVDTRAVVPMAGAAASSPDRREHDDDPGHRSARRATRGIHAADRKALRIVVAGTGAILQQGRNGDLDVLLTHDRAREVTFVADQQGLWRKPVMYNWFVL